MKKPEVFTLKVIDNNYFGFQFSMKCVYVICMCTHICNIKKKYNIRKLKSAHIAELCARVKCIRILPEK